MEEVYSNRQMSGQEPQKIQLLCLGITHHNRSPPGPILPYRLVPINALAA